MSLTWGTVYNTLNVVDKKNVSKDNNTYINQLNAPKEKKLTIMIRLKDYFESNQKTIVIIWLFGMLYCFSLTVIRRHYLLKDLEKNSDKIEEQDIIEHLNMLKKQNNIKRNVEYFYCNTIQTPIVLGTIRPKMYFPKQMDFINKCNNGVIKHEFIHIKSLDVLYKKIIIFVKNVFWFNPFVYVLKNCAISDVEFMCDSNVVKDLSKEEIANYCHSILNSIPVKSRYVLSFSNTKRKITKRIDNCVDKKKSKHKTILLMMACILVLTVLLLTSILAAKVFKNDDIIDNKIFVDKAYTGKKDAEEVTIVTKEQELSKLSQKAIHYDTNISISREQSEMIRDAYLGELNDKDKELVKEYIWNFHSMLESYLIDDFSKPYSPEDEAWNLLVDNPEDNVIPSYTIPDMITDVKTVANIINKKSFYNKSKHIEEELRTVENTHDIDLLFKIHQEIHDLSYWAINYPVENLDVEPADWKGLDVYFGTLNDSIEDLINKVDSKFRINDVLISNHPVYSEKLFTWNKWNEIEEKCPDNYDEIKSDIGANGWFILKKTDDITYILPQYSDDFSAYISAFMITSSRYRLNCGLYVGMNENEIMNSGIKFQKNARSDFSKDNKPWSNYTNIDSYIYDQDAEYIYTFDEGYIIEEDLDKTMKSLGVEQNDDLYGEMHIVQKINIVLIVKNGVVDKIFVYL